MDVMRSASGLSFHGRINSILEFFWSFSGLPFHTVHYGITSGECSFSSTSVLCCRYKHHLCVVFLFCRVELEVHKPRPQPHLSPYRWCNTVSRHHNPPASVSCKSIPYGLNSYVPMCNGPVGFAEVCSSIYLSLIVQVPEFSLSSMTRRRLMEVGTGYEKIDVRAGNFTLSI